MKSHHFDMRVVWDGVTLRAIGSVDPGEDATGPTYDCGGTPGCPAMVDDVTFYETESGSGGQLMEIEDIDGKILASVEDEIIMAVSEAVASDKAEAMEHRMDSDRDR